jgi:trigger factor
MSTPDEEVDPAVEAETVATAEATAEAEPKRKLDLAVEISATGPCKKHIKVTIARAEVERQFDTSLVDLRKEAAMPGFRPGRAPRVLIQKRYRKEVSGQVKSALVLAALEQLDEDYDLNPISQPQLDVEAISLPEDGPLLFEMDLEVYPEFQLPSYEGLKLTRPVKEISDADVEAQLKQFLERYAQLVPKLEGTVKIGDYVVADLHFHRDGVSINHVKEVQFRVEPQLRFQDGHVPELAKHLVGAKAGDVREATAHVGSSSADAALRGQTINVTIQVQDLKKLRLPEVDEKFLDSIGFDTLDELKQGLREVLERRLAQRQRQSLREQILAQLLKDVPFELPANLVARQERSTVRRLVNELKQSGMSPSKIRAREAEIRANAHETTLRSLKEFFVLARVAETHELKVEDQDMDLEYASIAERTDDSVRRVRSRIQKEGLRDSLATEVLERKAIDHILESAVIEDVPLVEEAGIETLDHTATSGLVEPPPEEEVPVEDTPAAEDEDQADRGAKAEDED